MNKKKRDEVEVTPHTLENCGKLKPGFALRRSSATGKGETFLLRTKLRKDAVRRVFHSFRT